MLRLRLRSNSGIIMIVVLWIVLILAILAVGLGRRSQVDLILARQAVEATKADYAAWAGIFFAIDAIESDTKSAKTSLFDTLSQCGLTLPEETSPEEFLKEVAVGTGAFRLAHGSPDDPLAVCYGLDDEGSRINVNAASAMSDEVLKYLMIDLGVEAQQAEGAAAAIVDWADADQEVLNPPYGAEDDHYLGLAKPYHVKNKPFESLEELLLVRGMTPEIFAKVKGYLTVFPQGAANIEINVNTASLPVLRAVLRAVADQVPNFNEGDLDSLTQKIIAYRNGEDGVPCSADDRPIALQETSALNLNMPEQSLFLSARGQFSQKADYLRIRSIGMTEEGREASRLSAVVDRENLSIVSFRRE